MGTNSSTWDREAHYARMSQRELEKVRDELAQWAQRHPDHRSVNVELEFVRMKLAERIGKK